MTDTLTPTTPPPPGSTTERLSKWGDDGRPVEPRQSWVRLAILGALLALLFLLGGWPPLFIVGAIVVMITLHELGHFVTAKWAGMKVTEFFLFFGPRIWSTRRGETEYGVKVIPAGAYVKIVGMHNLDEVAPEDEPRTYRQQSYPKRMAVALAGSTMHFILALVMIFGLLTFVGAPGGSWLSDQNEALWQVASISKLQTGESPAEQAGLRLGDRIVAFNGDRVETFDELRADIQQHPGETVTLTILRAGGEFDTTTTLASTNPTTNEKVGFLGISPDYATEHVGVVEAIPRSFGEFGAGVRETFGFFGAFFSRAGLSDYTDQVLGREPDANTPVAEDAGEPMRPASVVGIVRIADDAAAAGFSSLILILVAINIFVGIFNLIPLLPFDGGHAAIATYERLRSRKGKRYYVDISRQLPITYLVVMLLGMLFLSTLFLDIFRFPS